MASRLHESINSFGVLLSLAVSFFTLYYEHLATSEAVDALLSNLHVRTDDNTRIERITADLIFVNKGDTSVTVSDLWFEVDSGIGTFHGRLTALKANEDTVIVPIELPSKHAVKVTIAFKYLFIAAPFQIEKMSIALSLTTIGPVHGCQEMKMPIGLLHIDDDKLRTYGAAFVPSELILIRQDPPLLDLYGAP
jgi:hypothetical protein